MDDLTRFVDGLDGGLALTTGKSGGRVVQLVDLHGDIIGTVPVADGASAASWSSLVFRFTDEFGVPQVLAGGATANAPPGSTPRYGWLGSAQRSGEALGGVVLMGVRLYHPGTGRFLSVDPVAGGSASAYDYCHGDPVNCTDLAGTWGWGKITQAIAKKVAVIAEVASNIPGPIGAASAAVSAGAYAVTGNKAKAIEMGIVAAAALVGAGGAVKVGMKVLRGATATAGKGARAATKVERGASKGDGLLSPGPHAGGSIPAKGPKASFTKAERDSINQIGAVSKCHRCRMKVPEIKKNFVPDHQPPSSLNPSNGPRRLFLHCLPCSRQQGLFIIGLRRKK